MLQAFLEAFKSVTVISNANGKNAVTGDLHEGDSVKIMREKK